MNSENSDIETETPEIPVEEISKENTPAEEPVAGDTVATEGHSRRGGSTLALFAFLFALAALAGSGWMWWQDQASSGQEEKRVDTEIARLESSDSELSLKLSQIRNEMDSLAAGDVGAEFEAMQKRLQADRSKIDSVEQAISALQSAMASPPSCSESGPSAAHSLSARSRNSART